MTEAGSLAPLHSLIVNAAARLRVLGTEPIMIACAPDKFNDANYDDFWCAAQVGEVSWEQAQYFRRRSDVLAREKGNLSSPTQDSVEGIGTSLLTLDGILKARTILNDLERGGWRALAADALYEDLIMALIIQFNQTWLLIGNPQALSRIYVVHDEGISHFADQDSDRLDDLVGHPNLIRADRFHRASFRFLSRSAVQQFAPRLVDPQAAGSLVAAVTEATGRVRSTTDRTVMLRAAFAPFGKRRHKHPGHWFREEDQARVRVEAITYSKPEYDRLFRQYADHPEMRARHVERFAFVHFEALNSVVNRLDEIGWRFLFEAAFAVDTFDTEDLYLLVTPSTALIIHRTLLFGFREGALAHLGFLRRMPWLFDAAELTRIGELDPELVDVA